MSPSPQTFILTSSPYTLSQITLASFVPNIKQPHQDAKRPYVPKESDYTVQSDSLFEGSIDTSSKSFLEILATKFASFSASREKTDVLRILSESGRIYSLNNPDEVFESVLFGSGSDSEKGAGGEMQRWLERCRVKRQSPGFVTGFRTFVDASVVREEERKAGVSGGVEVPIGSAVGDFAGLTDLQVRLGREQGKGVRTSASMPGERVYAICYRRIKIRELWGGKKETAELEGKNRWKSVEGLGRGGEEDEIFVVAGLEGEKEVERRYEVKGGDGEASVIFGELGEWEEEEEMDTEEEEEF